MPVNAVILIAAVVGPAAGVGSPERSVLGELQVLDRELNGAEESLLTVEEQDRQLREEMARIATELASARVRKSEAFAQFQQRVRALAAMPAGARLVLLGGSRSLADYLEATRVLRWIANHDRKLQESYLESVESLSGLEDQMERQRAEHRELVESARAQRDRVAARRQQRLEMLGSLARDANLRNLTGREKRAARVELTQMVTHLAPQERQRADFAHNRGKLPWPAAGDVDVRFGQRVERAYGTTTSHNGIDIRAKAGSPVQAIAGGQVVFADWLKGYGRLVIVDHGNHYHSLAAHLAHVDVRKGTEVTQGTRLGTVGDTGSMHGTVLYFEIRERGIAVDPLAWLRR